MELEELFANRALLKKMSAQDHIQMHVLCKSPRLPHRNTEVQTPTPNRNLNISRPSQSLARLMKPPSSMCLYTPPTSSYGSLNKRPSSSSSLNKRPSSSSSLNKQPSSSSSLTKPPASLTSLNNSIRSMIKPDEEVAPPVVFVPEGYGCKVPKTFRRCTDVIKITFLLLYIFGLPVILYQLHTNLQNTKRRIHHLNSNDFNYFLNKLSYMKTKKSGVDYVEKSYPFKGRNREYKETISQEENMMISLKTIQQEINKDMRRSYVIASVEKWLKDNPEFRGEKCHCDVERDCANYRSGVDKRRTTVNIASTTKAPPENKQLRVNRKTFVKVYTRWGRKSCKSEGNTTMLYHGVMATTSNLRGSNGANYLCLPDSPKYNKNVETSSKSSSFIYGSLLDVSGYRDSLLINISAPGFHRALCSVCEVTNRKNVIMLPGTLTCPVGWTVEYDGYIMAQRVGKKRTQFVCVDRRPDMEEKVTKSIRIVSSLNFVESKCRGLLCMVSNYVKYAEVVCVICSQ